ncbi:MAG: hypothetical protein KGL20_04075, partial [Rhodospirillales bacterium]|nr:hypothetical protein [Rhodospirillales bacterium]
QRVFTKFIAHAGLLFEGLLSKLTLGERTGGIDTNPTRLSLCLGRVIRPGHLKRSFAEFISCEP